ncbi:DUF3515 domain-containing protein [Nocardiopsis ansamitocini]|uniref:DUF3515 domain-containing protein n=1 Tax=Nocardiopsis ansamitocini TaxID=1670832 RepID=A0A9W6P3M3_9ACTN|nr:DUF3515 domain-containing protein [Nocardiopsis ansamitocini]GLU46620.1 hypothetical protein Nans01_09710 [Nocardiopsis ansamitocini]
MRAWVLERAAGRVPAVVLATVVLALSGCGAVRVPATEPEGPAAAACRTLMPGLPGTLYEQERVEVEPDSEFVAAWGSPTIALRCGVPRPEGLRPDSELFVVNDITWLGEPAERPTLFTAVGREAYVEVSIPQAYQPPALGLVALSELVAQDVPALPAGEL